MVIGMVKRVELLAPAGNYEAFVGAVNAGADAVYLGGAKFGARAYADNFSQEEICRALRYAHIFGKKVYLTVNTLVKEREFSSLYEYLGPLYEAGLDGVIIQDLGVWQYIRETFPGMALHASTQMTITGSRGAQFLKEIGAARIVPARELSLSEIRSVKKSSGLELECFIHGAMCYGYSGQCLFSSILGGRSGNRGRCAQPCRLPYRIFDQEGNLRCDARHVLSLKDMCTISFLPRLIEAGIDSFKIEGRMKRPEYAAGVTAVYRKYIDAYYEKGAQAYRVEQSDMDRLQRLYIRDEVQTGYYERRNGREMITLKKPGYLGQDAALLSEIAQNYLGGERKCRAALRAVFRIGEPACLQLEGEGISLTLKGRTVERARKQPMLPEDFLKHLRKTGNSFVKITEEQADVEEGAFMPVSLLNELRRTAAAAYEDRLIERNGLLPYRKSVKDTLQKRPEPLFPVQKKPQLHVAVQNLEQLRAALRYPCERIYLDSDWYLEESDQISQCFEGRIIPAIFLALPYIVREKDFAYFQELLTCSAEKIKADGFLVRNLESLSIMRSLAPSYVLVADAGVYCFNTETARFLRRYCAENYLPYELNGKECRQLVLEDCAESAGMSGTERFGMSAVVYGTIPMMLSANCVRKTAGSCQGQKNPCKRQEKYELSDRYHVRFPVQCRCRHCYNIIYNSVPFSLHQKKKELTEMPLFAKRLDFVWETEKQVEKILDYYFDKTDVFPAAEYTAGHYMRGVE